MAAISMVKHQQQPMQANNPAIRQIYALDSSGNILAGSQPAIGINVQTAPHQKLVKRPSEAIEVKQTKLMQTLARDIGGAYLSVNINTSAASNNNNNNNNSQNDQQQIIGSFSPSDNSFILNPAAFSHVIEQQNNTKTTSEQQIITNMPTTIRTSVQPLSSSSGGESNNNNNNNNSNIDGTSSARRKTAPRMGVRTKFNFITGIDEKPATVTMKTVSENVAGPIADGGGNNKRKQVPTASNKQQQASSKKLRTLTGILPLPLGVVPTALNGRCKPIPVRSLHASRLSLDVSNLGDYWKTSSLFPTAALLDANKRRYPWIKKHPISNSSQDIGIHHPTLAKFCRCEQMKIRRQKELLRRIEVLFKLSLVGCLFCPPIGIVAILLCQKAKRLNVERTRLGFSEPYALAMTPHFHAHQVNMITKKVLFCVNAIKYTLLAETIIILLTLMAYALFAGIVAKCRDLVTMLLVLLITSATNTNNGSNNNNNNFLFTIYNKNFSHPRENLTSFS